MTHKTRTHETRSGMRWTRQHDQRSWSVKNRMMWKTQTIVGATTERRKKSGIETKQRIETVEHAVAGESQSGQRFDPHDPALMEKNCERTVELTPLSDLSERELDERETLLRRARVLPMPQTMANWMQRMKTS